MKYLKKYLLLSFLSLNPIKAAENSKTINCKELEKYIEKEASELVRINSVKASNGFVIAHRYDVKNPIEARKKLNQLLLAWKNCTLGDEFDNLKMDLEKRIDIAQEAIIQEQLQQQKLASEAKMYAYLKRFGFRRSLLRRIKK